MEEGEGRFDIMYLLFLIALRYNMELVLLNFTSMLKFKESFFEFYRIEAGGRLIRSESDREQDEMHLVEIDLASSEGLVYHRVPSGRFYGWESSVENIGRIKARMIELGWTENNGGRGPSI